MKYFLLIIVLIFGSYNAFSQEINLNELKKDPELLKYKQISSELKSGILSGKFKLPPDFTVDKLKGCTDAKCRATVYLKEGMLNAEEYVKLEDKMTLTLKAFIDKHPELQRLEQSRQREVWKSLLL